MPIAKEAVPAVSAPTDPGFGIAPRPEAFAPKELTEAQGRAVQGIKQLVGHWARLAGEAAEGAPTLPHGPLEEPRNALRLPWLAELEERRHAQVTLIDGERGTGKTSALLRLRMEWARVLQRSMAPDVSEARPESHVVVPLPILDLQPHPPRQSLLGVLLGIFEPLHRALLPDEEEAQRVPAYLAAPPQGRWRYLQRAWDTIFLAVAAWEGHAQRRSDRLAEDVYWRDLRDETARVSRLSEHFRSYIDALVRAWRDDARTARQRPLFAVMVDDADMNPSRSVELLELLRTLSHPRVFFVLTGDSSLFELMLRKHLRSATAMPQAGGDSGLDDRDTEIVQGLAWDVLDRIIPPPQRMKMAAGGRWPEASVNGVPHAQLRHALRYLRPDPQAEVPLEDFFQAPDDAPGERRFQDALPPRLREALDLTLLIRARLGDTSTQTDDGDKPSEPAYPQNEVLTVWWEHTVRNLDGLFPELRRVVTRPLGEGRERLVLHRPPTLAWKPQKHELARTSDLHSSLTVYEFGRYVYGRSSGEPPLPYAVEDMLQLLNDTLWGDLGGRLVPASFEPLVVTHWPKAQAKRPWSVPRWRQFTSYYRFANRLKQRLSNIDTHTLDAEHILLGYYEAVSLAPLGASENRSTTAYGWADVRVRTMRTSSSRDPEQEITNEWFRRKALLLLGPAYGLFRGRISEVLANEGGKFALDWQELLNKTKSLVQGLDALQIGLESNDPDPWTDFLEKKIAVANEAARQP